MFYEFRNGDPWWAYENVRGLVDAWTWFHDTPNRTEFLIYVAM